MRNRLPERRTLPSRTVLTFKARPISLTLVPVPLNEKAEVRAATLKSLILASEFKSSSDNPSQKYSLSGSLLTFTKGKTAIDDSLDDRELRYKSERVGAA